MARKQRHFVQALARGLNVLQAFSAEHSRLTLSQISERTGFNVVAVQRYTDTLMEMGFLKRNRHREFFLGPGVLSLGFAFLNRTELKKIAEEYISEFSDRVGRTLNMAILDGAEIIFIYRKEVHRFLSYDLHAGSKLPAHCTGSGKCLLAGLDDDSLKELLRESDLYRVTAHTIVDPEVLWKDLMLTRKRGYSIADREWISDLYSLGVPIINREGKMEAAVNLSLSLEEAKGSHLRDMVNQFIELGHSLSLAMGYQGPYPVIPIADPSGDAR
ncbi:MAG: helix-turn-helix domain-containing protein [Desulfarculaceae bacterium]|nr:helix-turn-helix domain-containing protein [Desulfarculaceae bacterium]MCF8047858.1 helix-turn-helix domain-containing protein [Desulfarculaceae bacterium]MCF8066028.1 helix-turn-helix domain-containing protein [Desulfarculaceae bacterium]MCF8096742.1 helix-turn-helix domain-containing protein [Desulfarculaceae bacterium]